MRNVRMIKVGLVQQANGDDVRRNMERLASAIRQCARDGAELVVLQERNHSLPSP